MTVLDGFSLSNVLLPLSSTRYGSPVPREQTHDEPIREKEPREFTRFLSNVGAFFFSILAQFVLSSSKFVNMSPSRTYKRISCQKL